MTNEFYEKLKKEAILYCNYLGWGINPMDFLHDIICNNTITEENYKRLFYNKKMMIINELKIHPISLDNWFHTGIDLINGKIKKNRMVNYVYCYHCNLVFPEHEMYPGHKMCKSGVGNKNIGRERTSKNHNGNQKKLRGKQRGELSASYIKDILRKQGIISPTEDQIKEKTEQIAKKRLVKLGLNNIKA